MKLSLEHPAWLSELESLTDLAELPLEIGDGLVEFSQSPQKFIAFNVDDSRAALTGECVVRLDPTDRLRGLMAALRARESDFLIVEHAPIHS
jgi:hypothetical protein